MATTACVAFSDCRSNDHGDFLLARAKQNMLRLIVKHEVVNRLLRRKFNPRKHILIVIRLAQDDIGFLLSQIHKALRQDFKICTLH